MSRPSRDETGLQLAAVWARRGTCLRRKVGCVLTDAAGNQLASGYNGRARGLPHCDAITTTRELAFGENFTLADRRHACPGTTAPSGQALDACEAIHAEANALLRCQDVTAIETAYVTHSPCVHCVKLLMNTSCARIVFAEPYAHDAAARTLWLVSTAPALWGSPRKLLDGTNGGASLRVSREWVHLPGHEALRDPQERP